MKKLTILIMLLVLPFVLTACLKKEEPVSNNMDNANPENTPTSNNKNTEEPKGNVFTSVRDAVTRQIGLKCDYVDEDGKKTETYIKGNRVYMEGMQTLDGQEVKYQGLIIDNNFYLWGEGSPDGMKLSLDEDKYGGGSAKMGETEVNSVDDVINKLEENKQNCSVSNISASKFEVPSDINFVEL